MKNIYLAPRSNETSYKNFESTIIAGRPYSDIEPFLDDGEKKILSHHTVLSIWGTKESLRSRWADMKPGDYVLFYAQGIFYYSANVLLTKHSYDLGKRLWPVDEDGEPWTCLFFVENLKEIKIPIEVIQQLANYSPSWDRVQGFMKLNEQGTKAIIDKLGDLDLFMNLKPEGYEALSNLLENNADETLEVESITTKSKEQLLAEASSFIADQPSHTIDFKPKKVRIENKQQKKRIAAIEDYSCQICNWKLEYKNQKGLTNYRIDIDHIEDKANGGGEEMSNLWALCPNCHAKKTMGIITVNKLTGEIKEKGEIIKLHHDNHLKW